MASNPALIRQQLNLKNLRRHDSSIEEIVASTSYTTVYYNTGEDWVKTNIEGPMFLFRRSVEPTHGFFILNRNGLEYVHELLTPDSEVRMDGEFILYEPHAEADRATGIWVWEEKERVALCARMEELRLLSCPPPPAPAPQATPLDFLFASSLASPAAPAPAVVPAQPQGKPAGMQLLDSIFKSANPHPPPPAPATKSEPPRDARALLAMIGHPTALLSTPQPVAGPNPLLALLPQLPQQQQQPPVPQQQLPKLQQQSLIAQQQQPRSQQLQPSPQQQRPALPQTSPQQQRLLISASQAPISRPPPTQPVAPPTQPVSHPPPTAPTSGPKPPAFAPPLLSHDVFALPLPKKATVPAPAKAVPALAAQAVLVSARLPPATVKEEPVKKVLVKAVPNLSKEVALELLDAAAAQARLGMNGKSHNEEREPLDKNEFVREVMGLLQKSAVTTALYSGYLRRFSEEEEERGR